ncbi:aldehyde dehydrogenase family protein [Bradyrhizobium sp. AZCC 1678]|uniref:aldehyde dehydrogenase family protein n=1 Tax=Bradyrhizobium sp. AZCC 1678 TaxID=3117030 RepID=UPI002FF2DDC4
MPNDVAPAHHDLYINGAWDPAASGATYLSDDPFLGTAWAQVPDAGQVDVDRAVMAAKNALTGPWGAMTGVERSKLLRRLGDLFAERAEELAIVESRDNGRLLKDLRTQMHMLPDWYYYYAGLADKIGGEVLPSGRQNFFVYTVREPVGVVAAIVPWNSPLWLITWKVAPALAAGCTMVLKPSDYTPVSALKFAELVHAAGFPPRRVQRRDGQRARSRKSSRRSQGSG